MWTLSMLWVIIGQYKVWFSHLWPRRSIIFEVILSTNDILWSSVYPKTSHWQRFGGSSADWYIYLKSPRKTQWASFTIFELTGKQDWSKREWIMKWRFSRDIWIIIYFSCEIANLRGCFRTIFIENLKIEWC